MVAAGCTALAAAVLVLVLLLLLAPHPGSATLAAPGLGTAAANQTEGGIGNGTAATYSPSSAPSRSPRPTPAEAEADDGGDGGGGYTFAPTVLETHAPADALGGEDVMNDELLYERVQAEIGNFTTQSGHYNNLVFVVADQMRWDTLGHVQQGLAMYRNKLKISTPNLDRLARDGVSFATAYCQAPVCASSRGSFYTGNTLRRTGIANNNFASAGFYQTQPLHRERIVRQRTFQQRLTDGLGFKCLHLGKWHLPSFMFYSPTTGKPLMPNYYSFREERFSFTTAAGGYSYLYDSNVGFLLTRAGLSPSKARPRGPGGYSYTPISLDRSRTGRGQQAGRSVLGTNFTETGVIFRAAIEAVDVLVDSGKPFVLSVQVGPPHPPYISTPKYMDPYYARRGNLATSPSISTAAYRTKIAELVAVYYGMVEEIDAWVGELMDKLEARGAWNNTLFVFASDHGEMLGAHNTLGKTNFYEESARVPLLMSLPNGANKGTRVSVPVSLLDLHSTILDYLGAPGSLDTSDGRSLRRHVERSSYNQFFDDTVAVSEYEYNSDYKNTRKYGQKNAFMVRKGPYKLIVPRVANAPILDQLYNLNSDPYELNNLVKTRKSNPAVIGKAESLKVLLVEWMRRNDGTYGYYSNPKYSYGRTRGDVQEIRLRRTWNQVPLWVSDSTIAFGAPTKVGTIFRRTEYLYLGRTLPGAVKITRITVKGTHASYFTLSVRRGTIGQNGSLRVGIRFASNVLVGRLSAYVEIITSVGTRIVSLTGG